MRHDHSSERERAWFLGGPADSLNLAVPVGATMARIDPKRRGQIALVEGPGDLIGRLPETYRRAKFAASDGCAFFIHDDRRIRLELSTHERAFWDAIEVPDCLLQIMGVTHVSLTIRGLLMSDGSVVAMATLDVARKILASDSPLRHAKLASNAIRRELEASLDRGDSGKKVSCDLAAESLPQDFIASLDDERRKCHEATVGPPAAAPGPPDPWRSIRPQDSAAVLASIGRNAHKFTFGFVTPSSPAPSSREQAEAEPVSGRSSPPSGCDEAPLAAGRSRRRQSPGLSQPVAVDQESQS